MNKRINHLFSLFLSVIIIIVSFCPVFAIGDSDAVKTIKIGITDYQGFINKDEDGNYIGYGVDLLNEISKYTGWNYEYIDDSFSNHLESLKNGTVDFICHAQHTPERDATYLFSKYSSGTETSVLFCREDDYRYYYNDYEHFNGMKVGLLQGSFQNDEFIKYAEKQGFSFTSVIYPTQDALSKALDNKEIDAIALGSLGGIRGYKVISLFGSDPFYFMTGKKNSEFVEEIDNAMGQISAQNPTFITNLFNKYYGSTDTYTGMLLTREESKFISSSDKITVGLLPHRSPLSYADSNGNPTGMTVDLMKLISKKTGLTFEYKFLNEAETGMDFLQSNKNALVAGVMSSVFSQPNKALLLSEPLQNGIITFVGKNGMNFNPNQPLTLALPAGFINGQKIISKQYPNFKFIDCTDNNDCLNAIKSGKADIMLQNMYVVRERLQSPLYEGLEFFPAYSFEENMLAVTLPQNKTLMSIVNKAISSFSDDDKSDIVLTNTVGKVYKPSTKEILYKYRTSIIGICILLFLIIFLCLFIIFLRQKNYKTLSIANKKLEKTNNQLEDAVKQADNANSAKSQFLARMSHELRTPMNAIVGLTTIAKAHINEKIKVSDYLTKIEASSRVLLNIINDVLDMSAIESNKLKIDESDFDIKKVLTGISTIYYTQCKDKNIQFDLKADLTHEMLIGDSLRVNQILLNLVSNSFKFTPSGGRIIITATENRVKNNVVYIEFKVQDTGVGISDELKKRLFKPFEQESSKTAQKHGGSGLGLSIAKNLVDMMNGHISVISKKNEGTTFTVEIPFKTSTKSNNGYIEDISKIKALIVDDEESACEYTSLVLKRMGLPHSIAHSGEEAIAMLKKAHENGDKYDICFLDWKMPGINGLDVTKKIREYFKSDTLIIIVSAYDLNEVSDEAKSAGADLFVTKPIFQSEVFNLLLSLTNGSHQVLEKQKTNFDFTGHKVLLAEDNELNREIATEILNLVNMEVDVAENGQEAVNIFTASTPGTYDTILMDIQMPIMDGYEATKAIRNSAHSEAKTIPILAMTANAFKSDVSTALNVGMNGHIAKPINTNILYSELQKSIDNKK